MLQGLAIWHYPHRTIAENVRFFAAYGLDSVSVHGCLPRHHTPETVEIFEAELELWARWQNAYGLISVLSFDVPQTIREGQGIGGYLQRVLDAVPNCKVAVEDFGLTVDEVEQIAFLKGNERFGYLVDLGHLFLRMKGLNTGGKVLFTNSPYEYPPVACPDATHFYRTLAAKEFPIFEIHLHNNDGVSDLHWFLEEGSLDVPAVAKALSELDFQGVLTVESAPGFRFECRGTDADEGIRKTLEFWKACLKEA